MRSVFGREAVFSVAALLISAIFIQTLYATVIRPRAAAILAMPVLRSHRDTPWRARQCGVHSDSPRATSAPCS